MIYICMYIIYVYVYVCTSFLGTGIGFIMTSSLMVLNVYFKKKLSLVTGMCFFGSGLGLMLIPQLFEILLAHYDTRGTMLLMAGCVSHGLIGCTLLRPDSYYEDIRPSQVKDKLSINLSIHNKQSAISELPDEFVVGRYLTRNPGYINDDISVDIRRNDDCTPIRVEDKRYPSAETTYRKQKHRETANLSQTFPDQIELKLSAVDLNSKPRHTEVSSAMNGEPADKSSNSQDISGETSMFKDIRKMFSIPSFPLYIIGQTCSMNGYLLQCIFLAPYAFDEGMSSSGVTTVMTTTGIVDMLARPLHGWFISSGFVNSNIYLGCLHLVASMVTGR